MKTLMQRNDLAGPLQMRDGPALHVLASIVAAFGATALSAPADILLTRCSWLRPLQAPRSPARLLCPAKHAAALSLASLRYRAIQRSMQRSIVSTSLCGDDLCDGTWHAGTRQRRPWGGCTTQRCIARGR